MPHAYIRIVYFYNYAYQLLIGLCNTNNYLSNKSIHLLQAYIYTNRILILFKRIWYQLPPPPEHYKKMKRDRLVYNIWILMI